ncbi:archaetidylserine decarboxylase [Hydrogenophaga palleronii]|uniref:archaetidylserine decarboxylase n=1 Tax=Hydrogenophaga palleronii TaxID=65655 RepID=UPI000824A43E|nr:archaetidylserine decarboxylase [Hydrogenophaga palleronii]
MSLFVALQHVFPKRALTEFAGWVANGRWGSITQWIIRRFIRKYGVNMAEAANPDPKAYGSFNEFFTRALRDGARPLADAAFVCPVDGAISQFGSIARDQIYQAKGHTYSTRALVGGDAELAALFDDGAFATIYLSPKDYHRIHMPAAATLRRMIHVPGDLFSVNPTTAQGVPGLFARNERVVCVFDLQMGEITVPFVQVLVGATIVGSMATSWHGVVNPPRPGTVREWTYDDSPLHLQRGEEMGRFLLGSTVVLLWPRDTLAFNPDWAPGNSVRLGEAMGHTL